MQKFDILNGIAAPLYRINIDTDIIIPKQFLKTIKRTGLGKSAFYELRYDADGKENPGFILNQEPFRKAEILLTGDNFGCGSSREHAPWALLDFGIRCVIAPSFADIFHNNCFQNGIVPVKLKPEEIEALIDYVSKSCDKKITVNLEEQKVVAGNHVYTFEFDPFRKHCLLNGLDHIGLTLQKAPSIQTYEQKRAEKFPWL